MDRSTIAAIATPLGFGGVGIVKVSGPHARAVADTLFKPEKTRLFDTTYHLKPHHLCHGWIVDPTSNDIVDEVLLAFMPAPHSYTCEDIVEIQAHSGIAVLSRILSLVLKIGARLAEPGEFTKRAYLNGRINLSQAEGVIDTIESKSHQALQMAMAQISGAMHQQVQTIRQALTDSLVRIETAIDFIEDPDDQIIDDALPQRLRETAITPLKDLVNQYQRAHLFRDGIKMAVVGKPNVGKSSLLNWLIKKDRAIVTEIPGTTRDLIEESVTIKGIPIVIVDTAGLRDDGDSIEKIGIQKTWDCIESADLILFMIDASTIPDENDHRIFNHIKDKNALIIKNKMDLLRAREDAPLPHEWKGRPVIEVSALKQTGIEGLEQSIGRSVLLSENGIVAENPLVPTIRQKLAIDKAKSATRRLIDSLEQHIPLEMAAIDAREAIDALGEITGETIQDSIIDQVFRRFCIGK
ncbi:MAG: tRNA uridine-5-carboxymethylaminomethyl(34) synthesis GTPase MnmE [Thermodesulfobacteriota bacterium]|nr:tRNA uridine-5-carboxymethylaminomethyl(34) synthesis GTPase MnmE [Thermodesulfobacteriota bacterium]